MRRFSVSLIQRSIKIFRLNSHLPVLTDWNWQKYLKFSDLINYNLMTKPLEKIQFNAAFHYCKDFSRISVISRTRSSLSLTCDIYVHLCDKTLEIQMCIHPRSHPWIPGNVTLMKVRKIFKLVHPRVFGLFIRVKSELLIGLCCI